MVRVSRLPDSSNPGITERGQYDRGSSQPRLTRWGMLAASERPVSEDGVQVASLRRFNEDDNKHRRERDSFPTVHSVKEKNGVLSVFLMPRSRGSRFVAATETLPGRSSFDLRYGWGARRSVSNFGRSFNTPPRNLNVFPEMEARCRRV